ncbi:endonuclease/exonuclease/phosphatase family protein [Yoonia sp. SDW83-1]|uniref:endonuclease/exonuclease/phosphatase family protein n=1 Tax=Yoonia sp. SDW83-1 TaxID=3366945 RepID=UPI00398C5307
MLWTIMKAFVGVLLIAALTACVQIYRNSGQQALPPRDNGVLRLATYNVHYIILGREIGPWSVGDWERRKGPLDQAFKALDADLVAFQEMESFQRGSDGSVNLARDWLLERNPGYLAAASGDWRSFPSTQPILYRADRLTLRDQGWFFFSDTPDVIYSRTFNDSFPAFASWAQFETPGGDAFRVVNVHFEYSSRSNRLLSAALVRDRIAPWINGGETVFVVGDLNARMGAPTMRNIEDAGVSFMPVQGTTYHFNQGLHLFGAIDHIGATADVRPVTDPVVLRQKFDGEWPTDHYPVVVDVALP